MKTTLLLLACCFLCAHAAVAELLITEVFYDAVGDDSQSEWVELLNTGTGTIDLAGYQLCFGGTGYDYSVNRSTDGRRRPRGCEHRAHRPHGGFLGRQHDPGTERRGFRLRGHADRHAGLGRSQGHLPLTDANRQTGSTS